MLRAKRDTLLSAGEGLLSPLEEFNVRFIAKSVDSEPLDGAVKWLQRTVGARWIDAVTRNLRHVHGTDRLPELNGDSSVLLVANHRSFFDLYVVTMVLVNLGMRHRIFFPVRANFFYDHPLGLVVNGAMSFFAMYPPVFRDQKRRVLNLASIDETVRLLKRPKVFMGLHPEGSRKLDDDPYTFLPAQSGVGRIIAKTDATVIPVFVNGLTNRASSQIAGNLTRKGEQVVVVFGKPIDLTELRARADVPRTHKAIAERTLEEIGKLGQEEKAIRARLRGN